MEKWKSHVRAELFQRDSQQKQPFSGLIKSYSRLVEKCELHECFWVKQQDSSFVEAPEILQFQFLLKEGEQVRAKLSQKASDLMTSLFLKEAELQYCHSQVSRYHREALFLARRAAALQASLSECEFAVESQSKELTALRAERGARGAELLAAQRAREELLERWMEEKREEAERMNEYNRTQERWQRLTSRLARHRRRAQQQLQQPGPPSGTAGPEPLMHLQPARPEPGRSDPPARPEPSHSDPPARPEPGRSDLPARPETGRLDPPARPEPDRSDPPARPEPGHSDTEALLTPVTQEEALTK